MRRRAPVYSICLVLALAGPARAHHSDSVFNRALTRRLAGVVKDFAMINPHSWLELVVAGADGQTEAWSLQTAGPDQLQRAGWKPQAIVPGERVKASYHPYDDGSYRGELVSLTLPDGQVLTAVVPPAEPRPNS